MPQAYGIGGLISVPQGAVTGSGVPDASFKGQLGQMYFDTSQTPPDLYIYDGQTWQIGGNGAATTTKEGVVMIDTTVDAADTDSFVPTAKAVYDYGQTLVLSGANIATPAVQGIGYVSSDAQAVARQANNLGVTAYFVTPANLTAVMSSPGPIGDTLADSGAFTTLDASGLATLSGSATITTGATALNLASDASTGAVNLGTGAGARTITIGNVTGATAVNINVGSGGSTYTTTNSTLAFVTGTGAINIGADAAAKTITIGNVTGATAVNVNSGSGACAWTTTNGSFGLVTGTGAINLGADAAAKTITIGNATGATAVSVNCGTGGANFGTSAVAHTTTVGSTTGASATVVQSGTGLVTLTGGQAVSVTSVAAAASPYAVLGSDYNIACDVTLGVLTVTLPAAPATGRTIEVWDALGQSAVNNITVDGNGKNISLGGTSAATKTIATAYKGVKLTYNGSLWNGAALA